MSESGTLLPYYPSHMVSIWLVPRAFDFPAASVVIKERTLSEAYWILDIDVKRVPNRP